MKRSNLLKYIFLLLLSLVPLLWFKGRPGVLINGVDTNFPLNPSIWFMRRFFVWTNVGNLGSDFSSSTAGTFFHFLQFILFKLGFSLQAVEIFNLIFWFGLIVWGSWFLASLIFPKKTFPQLIFVCLYALNIYLFNSFENVKVANLSLISSIPLGLSILILLRKKKIKRPLAFLLSFLIGIILSGSGINPAYIISFFLIIGLYVLTEIIANTSSPKEIIEISKDFLLISGGLVVVNLFWILPTISYILTNISSNNSIGSIGFTNWVNSLSENTSFVNVIRMQGAWDWYSMDFVTGLPLYIPYAIKYFTNSFFIGFSYLVPSLAFLAFLFKKKNSESLYIYFGITLGLGIFLTAGTHPPIGGLFAFFGRHVPFFSLFRSPWYIFAPLVGLSIAGLVGLFADKMDELITKKIVFYFISSVFIVVSLVYSYPLILGKIFRPNFNGSFYVKFPQYVFDTADYLYGKKEEGRILSYPDDNIEKFNWGYSGVDSILNLFSDKEIVFSPLNDTGTPISQIITSIFNSIKKREIKKANSLANSLGIDKIFDKKDQISFAPDLPATITQHQLASFGQWSFYQFPLISPKPKIYTASSLLASFSDKDSSGNLSLVKEGQILINPADNLLTKTDLTRNLGSIIRAKNSHQSEISAFQNNPYDLEFKVTKRNIDNVEYDFKIKSEGKYQPILENYLIDSFGMINQGRINATLDNVNITLNIDYSDDSYLYLSSLNLKEGNHRLVIANKNQINIDNYTTIGKANFFSTPNSLVTLNRSDNDAFINFKILNFDPYSPYLISVDSKYDYGKSPEIFTNQVNINNNQTFKSQQEVLPAIPEFNYYNFYFLPVDIPSEAEINLVAPFTRDLQGTKVEFRNLKVYKLFTNDLFLKKEPENSLNSGIITYNKNSPTSYSGEVKNSSGPQIIVFNEIYSPQWQLAVGGINVKTFHFTANRYANAWYIDGPVGNYKFEIYYKPQSLRNIGKIITELVALLGICWYMFEFLKKKNAKK